jgi:hypothetical protein
MMLVTIGPEPSLIVTKAHVMQQMVELVPKVIDRYPVDKRSFGRIAAGKGVG